MNLRGISRWSLVTIVIVIGTALAGCSNAPPPPATSVPAHEAAFLDENNTAMNRMMAAMEVPPSGDIDRDFARMMIPHHQGGIDMAEALLRHGKNEALKTLARAIITKQAEEIRIMQHYVGDPSSPPAAMPMSMPMGEHHHH